MSVLASVTAFCLFSLSSSGFILAGYNVTSNVKEHSEIDLDEKEMISFVDTFNFADAFNIYANGKNSMKSSGLRTLRGFSTTAATKLQCEPYFELYKKYYNRPDYADHFASSALNGTGDFASTNSVWRSQGAKKGSQYQNVWMYVIHEMEDSINDCRGNQTDNDGGVKAWDEAWAFYAGSLVGPFGNGSGNLIYTLAQKRCKNFGTCINAPTTVDGADILNQTATSNVNMLKLFNKGKMQLNEKDCSGLLETKNDIVKQMIVPLVQGVMRYILLTDSSQTLGKAQAEGWAFLKAVLPIVDRCNATAADQLVSNFGPKANPPMADGVDAVANSLFSTLKCMGINCDDVGTADKLPKCSSTGGFHPVDGSNMPSCVTCGTC